MITKTYVVKMAAEGDAIQHRDFVSAEIEKITFVRPVNVLCIDRDVPDSRFMREDLYSQEELDKAFARGKKEGCEEAWALARKIAGSPANGNYDWPVLRDIFGGDWTMMKIFDDSYETVKKKIFDYENTPKVGDIVTFKDPDSGSDRAVVTFVAKDIDNPNDRCYGLLYDDGTHAVFAREDLVKTNDHVDLSDIFKKLKGEE